MSEFEITRYTVLTKKFVYFFCTSGREFIREIIEKAAQGSETDEAHSKSMEQRHYYLYFY